VKYSVPLQARILRGRLLRKIPAKLHKTAPNEENQNMKTTISSPPANLTPRQMQILKQIFIFQASSYYSPTMAELAEELNLSRSTVFEHIAELRKKNLLSACQGKARSLALTSKAQELLNRQHTNTNTNLPLSNDGIPLLGSVAAGAPIEAIENKQSLSLTGYFGQSDQIFALKVAGDSMIEEDIRSGDVVLCRRSQFAQNGQLVIAIVDNENATLKKFYKQKSCARLEPANSAYAPIYTSNCRIEAVVIGLVRKF